MTSNVGDRPVDPIQQPLVGQTAASGIEVERHLTGPFKGFPADFLSPSADSAEHLKECKMIPLAGGKLTRLQKVAAHFKGNISDTLELSKDEKALLGKINLYDSDIREGKDASLHLNAKETRLLKKIEDKYLAKPSGDHLTASKNEGSLPLYKRIAKCFKEFFVAKPGPSLLDKLDKEEAAPQILQPVSKETSEAGKFRSPESLLQEVGNAHYFIAEDEAILSSGDAKSALGGIARTDVEKYRLNFHVANLNVFVSLLVKDGVPKERAAAAVAEKFSEAFFGSASTLSANRKKELILKMMEMEENPSSSAVTMEALRNAFNSLTKSGIPKDQAINLLAAQYGGTKERIEELKNDMRSAGFGIE